MEASANVAEQVDRARQFLRDIRDMLARHPVASKHSSLQLHERRELHVSVLRMSGTVDGLPVELRVHIPDHEPQRPRLEYSPLLVRMRAGQLPCVSASALAAAHDLACATHYPDHEAWHRTLRIAQQQSRLVATLGRGLH